MGKVLRNWNKGSTQVRGPLSAMLKSLQQLGWKMLNPFVLRDDKGQELHLAVGPPCVLRRHLQAALQRQHQSELEWKVITKSQVTDAEFEGLRRGGLSTWITKRFVNTDKHEFQSRRCIAQVATGKYVLAKHMQRYQLDVPGCCPLCSSADDSVYHRVFECPALLEQRRKALSEAMLNDALESGRHSSLYNMAVHVATYTDFPLVASTQARWKYSDGTERPEGADHFSPADGDVFCDGSCFLPSHPLLAHAGWSCIQMDSEGQLKKALLGCVPAHVEQSAVNAEHTAAVHAASAAAAPLVLKFDC